MPDPTAPHPRPTPGLPPARVRSRLARLAPAVARGDRTRPLVADTHGTGPTVVLLHGQPGTAWDWQWVTPLLEEEFAVVVPDRPGYGRTGGSASGFAGNAAALVDMLDRYEIEQAILVGHSWAGGVVMAAAEKSAERIRGAVLVSSIGPGEHIGWDDRLLAAPVVGEVIAAVTIGGTGLILGSRRVQRLADRRLAGRAAEAINALTRLTGGSAARRVWQSFVVEQRALVEEIDRLGPGLAGLAAVPTAIVNGANDHLVPPAVGDMLADAIPGATHTVIPGAGHLLPHDRPQEIADAVRDVHRRAARAEAGDREGQTDR